LNIPGQTIGQLLTTTALPFNNLQTLSVAMHVVDEKDVLLSSYIGKLYIEGLHQSANVDRGARQLRYHWGQ
jgi:hypothetical protein